MLKEYFESSTSSGSNHTSFMGRFEEAGNKNALIGIIDEGLNNIHNETELDEFKEEIKAGMNMDKEKLMANGNQDEFNKNRLLYNLLTDIIIENHKKLEELKEIDDHHKRLYDDNKDTLSDIDNVNMTSKRHIEINMNIIRKKEYMTHVFKIILIIIVLLVVVPILTKINVLNKMTGIIIWGIIVFIILLVMLYLVYYKNVSKDNNDYTKFNFINPNSQEVARSKLNVDLSESDQARCQAFSEVQSIYDTDKYSDSEFDNYKTPENECKKL